MNTWWTLWESGARMAQAGLRANEAARAAAEVVAARSGILAAAARAPLAGDYAELGRMVPEKLDAFSRAGMAAWKDVMAMQADAVALWWRLATIGAAGRLATPAEMTALGTHWITAADRASGAGGRAFDPIHARVTSNARRLRRRG